MRCSSCSAEVQPLVAVDIDGTLGRYHEHLLKFACDYLGGWGRPGAPMPIRYDGGEPFSRWFTRAFQCDLRTFRDIKLAYRQGGQKRSMEPYRGAASFVNGLRRVERAEVWLTTTRPYLRLDGIDPDTRHWLKRNGIEYDGLLYDEEKYARLAERIDAGRVVAVVDDLPEQYDSAAELFGSAVPILRKTSFNRGVHRAHEAEDLAKAYERIHTRMVNWRRDVAA